jgi:hypothetical protein
MMLRWEGGVWQLVSTAVGGESGASSVKRSRVGSAPWSSGGSGHPFAALGGMMRCDLAGVGGVNQIGDLPAGKSDLAATALPRLCGGSLSHTAVRSPTAVGASRRTWWSRRA